ncbi:AlpA family transcriptional regulator [Pusillimonas sp. ANT_WB101]|uniref:helix-turn-helix transcriptional regulator n=1 Tax=Pusillimonas sp. ANT_WB101 TaxID=2597356 RepID=UPI0011F04BEC|nr:AlpA family phage regulatory protein [Pusillimonas sp. ANT_WB101]KAA0889936.1 AlpA family phage regulatory protein [Pusillimonas sp. ANT_WB101]
MQTNKLPATGLLRLKQIIGDKKAGIHPLIPVSRETWYTGMRSGRYPQSVKIGAQAVAWRVEDIRKIMTEGV